MNGVSEEAAEFERDDAFAGLARFRSFGEFRPVYEVLRVEGQKAIVELVQTGEQVSVEVVDVLADPLAP